MVWMSLMAAVAGAAVASLGSALTATELLLLQEEGIALRAAARLSEETIEEREETIRELGGHFADDGDDDLSALERMDQLGAIAGSDAILELSLLDELEDVDLPRPRARIDVDGVLLAGDPSLPRPRVGDCIGFERADGHARACAVPFEEGVLVLSMSTLLSDARPEIMGWSVVVGFLVAAVLGWAGAECWPRGDSGPSRRSGIEWRASNRGRPRRPWGIPWSTRSWSKCAAAWPSWWTASARPSTMPPASLRGPRTSCGRR